MRRAHRLAVAAGFVLIAGSLGGARLAFDARESLARDRVRSGPEAIDRAGDVVAKRAIGDDEGARAIEERASRSRFDSREHDGEETRRTPRIPDLASRVVLDDPQIALGSAVAIGGRDPAAPRGLALWRIDGDREVRVATGRSDADGTLAFPPLVLPAGEVTLVAAPLGARPGDRGASAPVALRRDPSAPQLESISLDGGVVALRAAPVEAGGALVVTATGALGEVEVARVTVADDVERSRGSLDLSIALAADAQSLSIAHELSDGRRSARRTVLLSTLNPMENRDVESLAVVAP